MRSILTGMALLVALPCWAQGNGASHPPAPIVVTGNGLADSARQLEQCLARKCAPPEDIDASITLAENQLLAGDYRKARATLAAARDRNGDHRKDYPVAVADLERSYGRMTDLDGFPDRARIAQVDALDTLKGALDGKDTRVLIQRLTAGDDFRLVGRTDAADETYSRVEKQAREAGEAQVAGIAMLRSAAMYTFLASQDSIFRSTARARIARIERTTQPELEQVRIAARVLRARLTGLAGSGDAMDRAIANLVDAGFTEPVLVYEDVPLRDGAKAAIRKQIDSDPEWVDFRFRVAPDGRVRDLEEVRRSPEISADWANRVRKTVATRRYAPLRLPPGSDGKIRIERFTLVFDAGDATGSNMATRASEGRLTWLDITPDQPAPSIPPASYVPPRAPF
ncbi:hypothetical protein HNP52_003668 [Sphingomonas kyeonggiensis]|uniref:TonB family protein n=1 Tax=Sphingomonas kyeonggiensis TaxID=1268553 RepID=A0A7W7K4P8_9SPHN|nr:hypothetical protein [Sphingomonas kyeonggiensis]MBB4840576.1 hypothetical protein [Sphingomonas kyeonggiensis]